jgi:hypothetical protein
LLSFHQDKQVGRGIAKHTLNIQQADTDEGSKMAIPWLTALKIVPWEKVLEHAPSVFEKARGFIDKRRTDDIQTPTELEQLAKVQQEMAQSLSQLAEQNLALIAEMKRLQWRLKWLVAGLLMTLCSVGGLAVLVFQ